MKKKTLRKNFTLVSLIAIIVACVVFGSGIYYVLSQRYITNEMRNLKAKLKVIADDLEIQHNSMIDAWHHVSVSRYYNTGYLNANRFYEIEMLEDLAHLKDYTQLTDEYFLYFDNNNSIYTYTGSKYTPELFTRFLLNDYDTKELIEAITAKHSFNILHKGSSRHILFVLPKNAFTGLDSNKKVLCFIVDKQRLINRMELLAGKLEGELTLSYLGEKFCITDGNGDDIISEKSQSNAFQVTLRTNIPSFMELMFSHNPSGMWFAFFLAIILSVIGVSLGIYLYQPLLHIKNIALHYYSSGESENSPNEIVTVRNAFEQLANSRDSIMNQVDAQYTLLRNQMLNLILRGDSNCIERAMTGYMDINLSGRVLFVGIVQSVDEYEIQHLQAFEGSVYWCKGLQEGVYTAIVSTDSEYHAMQIRESLQQHFEVIDRDIVFSEFIDDPNQICVKAANTYKRLTTKPPQRKSAVNASDIVEYIRTNYWRSDLSLDHLSEVFNISPHYISSLVFRQTNHNYKEFLTDIRMKHAEKLVFEGKLMIKEIAEAVGYTNVSLFIRTYKATFGVTPSNSKQDN